MRRPIITQAWLADFERRKLQAEVDKRAQPEVASNKHQASSAEVYKRQVTSRKRPSPSDSKNFSKSSSDKQQAS